jgi:hypothetical protein
MIDPSIWDRVIEVESVSDPGQISPGLTVRLQNYHHTRNKKHLIEMLLDIVRILALHNTSYEEMMQIAVDLIKERESSDATTLIDLNEVVSILDSRDGTCMLTVRDGTSLTLTGKQKLRCKI